MDKICELIKQAHEIIINNNPTSIVNELENIISNQKTQIEQLILNQDKYLEQINNLKKELDMKNTELQKKNDEFNNLSKFSIIQNVHKQLDEKNNYIQILESQIDKQRKSHSPPSPKTTIAIQTDFTETHIKPKNIVEPVPQIVVKEEKKEQQVIIVEEPEQIINNKEPQVIIEEELHNDERPVIVKEKKKKKKDKYIIEEPEPINNEQPEPINDEQPVIVKEKKKKKKDKYIIEEPEQPIIEKESEQIIINDEIHLNNEEETQEPVIEKEKKKKKKDKYIIEEPEQIIINEEPELQQAHEIIKEKKKKDKYIKKDEEYSDNEIFINHNYDKPSKKKKNHDIIEEYKNDFDIDKFEDINGFELLIYKKIYYLRDLETNELYDILDNKQNKRIGLIVNGKVKLN